jgi:nucleoside-diphosphate-sugar epimerase
MAFVDLMDLALRLGVHHFVGLGSQAEYGTHSGRLNETALVRPTTLYGAAKLASYVLAERRLALASLPFAWIRVFSTFGPDDDPGTMISYLTSALLKRERPRLTAGEQKWDYLYVDDAARAIIAVVEAHATGVFNLGSGYAHRLRHVIETVRDLIDPSLPLGFGELAYRQDQVMHLEADITKLKNSTGWVPRYSLEEGLALTVNWMRGIFL